VSGTVVLFGEASVRKATAEFVAPYHRERNHQGLENRLISRKCSPGMPTAQLTGESVWEDC
jgi:hypothetical protein